MFQQTLIHKGHPFLVIRSQVQGSASLAAGIHLFNRSDVTDEIWGTDLRTHYASTHWVLV